MAGRTLILMGVMLAGLAMPPAHAAPRDILFSDDLDDGSLAPWTPSDSTRVGVNQATSNSAPYSMYLRYGAADSQTPVVDTSGLASIEIGAWIQMGADSFSEPPEAGENLVVEYLDSGGSWVQLDEFEGESSSGNDAGQIFEPSYRLDSDTASAAFHAGFRLRFRLLGGSGSDFDYWHIDDVSITERGDPIMANLVAEYRMEAPSWDGTAGEVADASGNGNDGTANGDATTAKSSPAIPGDPGTCRYGTFDGDGDYVSVSGLSDLLDATATLTFWVRTTQTGNDLAWQAPGISGVEQSGGADDIFWGWIDGSGRIGISVGNDYGAEHKSASAINDGAWHHVALTRNATSGETNVYVDGNLESTGTAATGTIGTAFDSIGRIEDTAGTPEAFAGMLDEVRIYDGTLNESQVQDLMRRTHTCPLAFTCSADADIRQGFEDGGLGGWDERATGPNQGTAGVDQRTAGKGSYSAFVGEGPVQLRSPGIDLRDAVSGELSLWIRRGADRFSNYPEAGEDAVLEYRDSTNNWHALDTFAGGGVPGEVFEPSYTLPNDAFHNQFQIRVRLLDGSGGGFDYWHIDNVCLTTVGPGDADHWAISHDGSAVSCADEWITIAAHNPGHNTLDPGNVTVDLDAINQDTGSGEGTWSSVITGSGTLSDATAGDGAASYTFPGNGETSVTLAFNYTDLAEGASERVNFDVNGGNEDAGAGEDDDLTVTHSGFRITDGAGNPINVPTQIAGKPSDTAPGVQALGLQAIRTSDDNPSVCEPAFGDGETAEVGLGAECKNPATCAGNELAVTNDGSTTAIDTTDDNGGAGAASYEPVDLTFGANAEAPIVVDYADAGAMQLHARFDPIDDSGDAPTVQPIIGSSNDFVVRPFGFYLDFDPDGDGTFDDRRVNAGCADQTSCAADASGDVFTTAGVGFSVQLNAVVWQAADDSDDANGAPDSNQALTDNARTPNFGQEASAETVDLEHGLEAPSGGTSGALNGATTDIGGFTGGSREATGLSWSEVGIMAVEAALSDGAYLGTEDVVGTAPDVGRFIPDRLELADNDPAFRDGTGGWASPFTYMGQAFTFDAMMDLEPRITVEAVNADGATTDNYGGEGTPEDFWRLGTPARTYADATDPATVPNANFDADQAPGTATWDDSGGTDTRENYDGTGTLTITGDAFRYERVDAANKQMPFDALVDLTLAQTGLTDSDGVCYEPSGSCSAFTLDGDDTRSGQQPIGDDDDRDPSTTELRFGRLAIDNASGSEIAPVDMPVRVEFWNENQTWQTNEDDSDTRITLSSEIDLTNEIRTNSTITTVAGDQDIDLADAPNGGFTNLSDNTASPIPFTNGELALTFAAPSENDQNKTGWAAAIPRLAGEHPYLQYAWRTDGDPNDDELNDDPRARVTFGIFGGNANWIHFRRTR